MVRCAIFRRCRCGTMGRKSREILLRCYSLFIFATLGLLIGYNYSKSGTYEEVDKRDLETDMDFTPQPALFDNDEFNNTSWDDGNENMEFGENFNNERPMIFDAEPKIYDPAESPCFDKFEASKDFNKTYSSKVLRDTVELLHSDIRIRPENETCESRRPSCIIIGVPKSGARVLLDFMQLNPYIQTYFSQNNNEMPYFNKYYPDKSFYWLAHSMPCSYSNQHTVIKGTYYFHDKHVPEIIQKFDKSEKFGDKTMKLILVVRDPIERLISAFTFGDVCRDVQLFSQFDSGAVTDELTTLRKLMSMSVYDDSMEVWLKYYAPSQILVVESNALKKDPASVLYKVESFLEVEHYITDDMFVFNPEKGFYCVRSTLTPTGMACYDDYRGRTHQRLPEDIHAKLKRVFEPRNQRFFDIVGKSYGW